METMQALIKEKPEFGLWLDEVPMPQPGINDVLIKIRDQFHADNYDRLYKMVAAYYNIFKKVVNSKSLLYKKEAARTKAAIACNR